MCVGGCVCHLSRNIGGNGDVIFDDITADVQALQIRGHGSSEPALHSCPAFFCLLPTLPQCTLQKYPQNHLYLCCQFTNPGLNWAWQKPHTTTNPLGVESQHETLWAPAQPSQHSGLVGSICNPPAAPATAVATATAVVADRESSTPRTRVDRTKSTHTLPRWNITGGQGRATLGCTTHIHVISLHTMQAPPCTRKQRWVQSITDSEKERA